MATRTIANGGGNWNATGTWVEGAVPTLGDDVVATATSGNLVINAAANCHSLDFTNYVGTLTNSGTHALTVGGGATLTTAAVLKFVAGMTVSGSFILLTITFDNRSGGVTVTSAGKMPPLAAMTTGANSSGTITFADNCNLGSTPLTHNRGTILFTSGTSFGCGTFSLPGAGVKGVTYSGATITALVGWQNNGTVANCTVTGDASSVLTCGTGGLSTFGNAFIGGGKAYPGTVNITGNGSLSMNVSDSFVNLAITGNGTDCNDIITLSTTLTCTGTFTATGAAQNQRLRFTSNSQSSPRAISVTGTVTLANVDFWSITGGGSGGWLTGTSIGDLGGNSSITFTAPVNRYWVGTTGTQTWQTLANWSTSDNGAGGASMPLAQDTAYFTAAHTSFATTFNISTSTHAPAICNIIDQTGQTLTTQGGLTQLDIFGNVTLSTGSTFAFATTGYTINLWKASTLTQNAGVLNSNINVLFGWGPQSLGSALVVQGNVSTQGTATLTPHGFPITCQQFSDGASSIIDSTMTLTGTGTVLQFGPNSDFSAAAIVVTDTSTTGKAISFNAFVTNKSVASLTVNSVVGTQNAFQLTASQSITIGLGAVTFAGGPCTFVLQPHLGNNPSWRIDSLTVPGRANSIVTFGSGVGGTQMFILKNTDGDFCTDYVSLQDTNFTMNGAYGFWYVGLNSTNVSNNTGAALKFASCKQLGSFIPMMA